jgi:hypothetical protein
MTVINPIIVICKIKVNQMLESLARNAQQRVPMALIALNILSTISR